MEILIVDRVEEGIAVCERDDGSRLNLKISSLPNETREGSVLLQRDDGSFEAMPDYEQARRKKLFEMQHNLFS